MLSTNIFVTATQRGESSDSYICESQRCAAWWVPVSLSEFCRPYICKERQLSMSVRICLVDVDSMGARACAKLCEIFRITEYWKSKYRITAGGAKTGLASLPVQDEMRSSRNFRRTMYSRYKKTVAT